MSQRLGTWHPVDLPGGTGGTATYDDDVTIARITVLVEWNSPRARRSWQRAVETLKLGTREVQRHGGEGRPRRIAFSVIGTQPALAELVRRNVVLSWDECDAALPYHGSGQGEPKVSTRSKPARHRNNGWMTSADLTGEFVAAEKFRDGV